MNVHLSSPKTLSTEDFRQWRELMRSQGGFDSPFYDPAYLRLLGFFRPQLEVALLKENNQLVAVFAYERDATHHGTPPGVKLCDYQGPIFRENFSLPLEELLRLCRLKSWRFDHQSLQDAQWKKWSVRVTQSPFIDLSNGYEAYVARQKPTTGLFSQTARKCRKLEREVGPVEFHWHTGDSESFETLLKWKSAQRKLTKTFDILQSEWVVSFLREIQTTQQDELQGTLSILTVNETLAAVHLGMATPTAFHYWFPSYNQDLQRYSPGLILLLNMIEEAARRKIQRFDFGKGEEGYKQSFATDAVQLAEGAVDFNPISRALRGSAYQAWEWVKSSPMYGPANELKRWIQRRRSQSTM